MNMQIAVKSSLSSQSLLHLERSEVQGSRAAPGSSEPCLLARVHSTGPLPTGRWPILRDLRSGHARVLRRLRGHARDRAGRCRVLEGLGQEGTGVSDRAQGSSISV